MAVTLALFVLAATSAPWVYGTVSADHGNGHDLGPAVVDVGTVDVGTVDVGTVDRSEERRVGKECRSRWAPDHEKNKTKTHTTKQTNKQH